MTVQEFVLLEYPNAKCILECSTDHLDDWEGPALYDYIIRENGKAISDYAHTPYDAWVACKKEIESR